MTYYDLLEIKEDATIEEIKKAYRDKVMLFHPDVNKHPNAPQVFISIQKAYETLSNTDRRKQYDSYLKVKNIISDNKKMSNDTHQQTNKGSSSFLSSVLSFLIFIVFFVITGGVVTLVQRCDDKVSSNTDYSIPEEETYKVEKEVEIERQIDEVRNDNINKDPLYSINNESIEEKYYISKGKLYNIPRDRVNDFLSTRKDARLATDEELSDFENKRAKEVELNNQTLNYIRPANGSSPYNSYYGAGVIDRESQGDITIVNGTSQDALVLVYEIGTKKIIRNIYVRSGDKANISHAPQGYLRMKTFYGNDWASDLNNGYGNPTGGFTKDVSFSEMASNERFDMNWEEDYSGISYPSYSVTLHKIANGNLQTKNIRKEQFFD